MNSHSIPNTLKNKIASKKTDFIIKSSQKQNIKKTIPALFFTLAFISVLSFIIYKFIHPILEKKELANTPLNINELKLLVVPAISFGIFIVIAIGLVIKTFQSFFYKESYFVGTEDKLIIYRNGKTSSKQWNEFSGKTTTKQKHNFGNLILELKRTQTNTIIVDEDIYNDNSDSEILHETIEMIGIKNVMNIESKCLYRIEKTF